jgi:hypothetical protein
MGQHGEDRRQIAEAKRRTNLDPDAAAASALSRELCRGILRNGPGSSGLLGSRRSERRFAVLSTTLCPGERLRLPRAIRQAANDLASLDDAEWPQRDALSSTR